MTQGEAIATHGTNKTQGKHQTLTQQQTGHHRGEGPGQPWRDVTVGESISPTPTAPGRECAGQRQLGWGPWPWGAGVGPRITPGVGDDLVVSEEAPTGARCVCLGQSQPAAVILMPARGRRTLIFGPVRKTRLGKARRLDSGHSWDRGAGPGLRPSRPPAPQVEKGCTQQECPRLHP